MNLRQALNRLRRRLPRRRHVLPAGRFAGTSRWLESTQEVARWERVRRAGMRWGIWGAVLGTLIGIVLFAPAAWLASAVGRATDGRLLLVDAQGTVWSGSAVAVLTGGAGSRDARTLPGRLSWTLRPHGMGLALTLEQPCCLNGRPVVTVKPGLGRMLVTVDGTAGTTGMTAPTGDWLGQWPAAWLAGLGTPWNTLDLGGALRLSTQGLALEWVQGRWRMAGQAELALREVSSRVTTLERLGSYRLMIAGDAATGGATMSLFTESGALQLSGSGQWDAAGARFRGEARAAEGQQGALDNLLNIIGRRAGDRSIISIG